MQTDKTQQHNRPRAYSRSPYPFIHSSHFFIFEVIWLILIACGKLFLFCFSKLIPGIAKINFRHIFDSCASSLASLIKSFSSILGKIFKSVFSALSSIPEKWSEFRHSDRATQWDNNCFLLFCILTFLFWFFILVLLL